tara:strand:+ start:150 stop:329 length:180 start_codon:yes stop_codon:yes gene_type:complete
MPDIVLYVGGVAIILGFIVGWGAIYRFAFRRGAKKTVEEVDPVEAVVEPTAPKKTSQAL